LYSLSLRSTLAKVDHVIAVSEAIKSEILSFYPDASVSVIYNGLDSSEFSAVTDASSEAVRKKLRLPHEFLLSVGHFERRKNYPRLLEAIALLRDRSADCHLVIIGNDSGERRHVEERIHALNLSTRVTILSGLSDSEVRCIYKLASLFVFSSSYEGFGIPILESMASGVPLVLSDIPVFREITENLGVYFPHDSVEEMADAIYMTLSSREKQKELIAYGKHRVKDFSFDAISSKLAHLYRSLAQ
jgi:glycosyltransferase involved in cell wall biosynthesis